ncbi:hypothetical protein [Mycolicibacterium komossense]|uniref:Uncharacterized protein n=1 Tax=Mycolicibacterium komossense TaxID=1779 RepID=A0ABT3CHH0_9MYCO|nr:hypothetical protein [Mycolicibacterium komossense]MCV7228943.1 hypothetical protein [Mycolicibacterium komossense]
MGTTEIAIADAAVDQRIAFAEGGPVGSGAFLVREITPLDADTVAVVLQSVDGGADVEATLPADLTVELVSE